jgi:hypothetical protein
MDDEEGAFLYAGKCDHCGTYKTRAFHEPVFVYDEEWFGAECSEIDDDHEQCRGPIIMWPTTPEELAEEIALEKSLAWEAKLWAMAYP